MRSFEFPRREVFPKIETKGALPQFPVAVVARTIPPIENGTPIIQQDEVIFHVVGGNDALVRVFLTGENDTARCSRPFVANWPVGNVDILSGIGDRPSQLNKAEIRLGKQHILGRRFADIFSIGGDNCLIATHDVPEGKILRSQPSSLLVLHFRELIEQYISSNGSGPDADESKGGNPDGSVGSLIGRLCLGLTLLAVGALGLKKSLYELIEYAPFHGPRARYALLAGSGTAIVTGTVLLLTGVIGLPI
jgi:hypothetical protein